MIANHPTERLYYNLFAGHPKRTNWRIRDTKTDEKFPGFLTKL